VTARLEIVAKPGARVVGIALRGGDVVVAVRERAVEGKANDAIARAVAAWLGLAPSRVRVLHGATGRRKVVAIDGIDDVTLRAKVERLAPES
jgi:uncharacterized protein YggU (UPF0235/DUF167 family)